MQDGSEQCEEAADHMGAAASQAATAFTRLWTELAGKMAMAGLSFGPNAPPPEAARQVRNSMFDAMTQYYDELMRSPQFLDAMKQGMDATILFRQQFNGLLTRMHHEMQGTAREDIDNLMLTIRHVETRLLDRMDELAGRVEEIGKRLDGLNGVKKARHSGPPGESGKGAP